MIPRTLWLALLGTRALAHGGLNNYTVGDTWYRGYDPDSDPDTQIGQPWLVQRPWASIDPVFEHDSPYLACNNPGSTAAAYIPIEAGSEIEAIYWYWLHPTGPMAVWLASCGDSCEDVDPAEADWFKIWHAGLTDDGSAGLAESMWYQKSFQNWDGSPATWPVTIPPRLKPGLYLIRHEIISIHVAYKPQWYPECAHLNISGTGNAVPGEEYLFKFPGAYSEDDPMTFLDIYSDEWTDPENAAKYTPPLGPVWDGGDQVTNKYCYLC